MRHTISMRYIRVPILNSEYWVDIYWNCNEKKALEIARENFEDENINRNDLRDLRGWSMCRPKYCPMIWLNLPAGDKHFFSTLAHEACHAVDDIWTAVGEGQSHEVYAHSVGAIVFAVESKVRK